MISKINILNNDYFWFINNMSYVIISDDEETNGVDYQP